MSGFSAAWLALREPYDARARNTAVLDAVARRFAVLPSIQVVDLACGTGASVRALAPRLPARQLWRLVDHDLSLLARAPTALSPDVAITAVPLDISRDLEAALDGAVDLVTTSALLDLVSPAWLERFAVEAAARRLPVYAALSYDGRIEMSPADPADAAIVAAVNAHQRTDKGFDAALGPGAARAAIEGFERVGYTVVHGELDWVFGAQDRDIQTEVLSGWASAARELGEIALADVVGWLTRRREWVAAGRSSIRVGHVDLFGSPIGRR